MGADVVHAFLMPWIDDGVHMWWRAISTEFADV
jgi:hypothetical protein